VRKKIRKTRVSRESVRKILDEKRQQRLAKHKNKKTITPGPWTNIGPTVDIKASLHPSNTIIGIVYGTYAKEREWDEKGWYPICINITSTNIEYELEKYGTDVYMASCERSLNSPSNKKKFGTIIILDIVSNNVCDGCVFISCRAKTNKKSIKGFSASRKKEYKVL